MSASHVESWLTRCCTPAGAVIVHDDVPTEQEDAVGAIHSVLDASRPLPSLLRGGEWSSPKGWPSKATAVSDPLVSAVPINVELGEAATEQRGDRGESRPRRVQFHESATSMSVPAPASPLSKAVAADPIGPQPSLRSRGDNGSEPPRRSRSRRISRRLTIGVAEGFARLYRRQSSLFTSSRRVPAPEVPNFAPTSSQFFAARTESIAAALQDTDNCPIELYLRESLGCYNIAGTPWSRCPDIADTVVRKIIYSMHVPDDVPASLRKLLSVPDSITCSMVWRLSSTQDELKLVQHSYTGDVMYGDRFRMQVTLCFRDEVDGQTKLRQWTELIWTRPLPWTHGVVKHFVEKRMISDATSQGESMARSIEQAAIEHQVAESGVEADPTDAAV